MAENDNQGQQATDAQQAEYWRQQAIAQNQQREAIQQQYNADMEKVYNVLTSQTAQQPQQAQQPQPEPWDVTDPTKLRENVENSMKQTVTQQMAPVVLALANNQYEAHMLAARHDERMPYFGYWEGEIRQLAKSVAPGLLAEYNTIVNLYKLAQMNHGHELVELEVRRRMAAQQQSGQAEEVEVEEDSDERSSQLSQPPVASQSPPPPTRNVPAPQAQGMQAPRSSRQGATRRLSREEAHMAERMGMSLAEYARAKDLGDVEI